MSSAGIETAAAAGSEGGPGDEVGEWTRPLHLRPFKLRFAAHRDLGRSYVSPIKPLKLPQIVTGKFYSRWEATEVDAGVSGGRTAAAEGGGVQGAEGEDRARRRSPKEKFKEPLLSSHEYGWYCEVWSQSRAQQRRDPRLWHALTDSAWLRVNANVLHHDNKLKGKI